MCNMAFYSNNTRVWITRFLFLLPSCYLSPLCQANDTLTHSQFLMDGQTLVSAGEVFVLGFFSPGTSTGRYVGIWYHRVPIQTVIWVANRDAPLNDSSGSLGINANGSLVVLDGKKNIIWCCTMSTNNPNSSFARLFNSGNLMLLRSGGDGLHDAQFLTWQSFDHPTDTYLLGMRAGLDLTTGENQLFTSWKSESDPSPGANSFGIDPRGLAQNFVWEGSTPQWRSGLWNGQEFIGVTRMKPLNLYGFKLSNVQLEQKMYFTYAGFNCSYTRFVIRPNGTYEQLCWVEKEKAWSLNWVQPSTECAIYNRCGDYGICHDGDTPMCSCLKGFKPSSSDEWANGNWSGGCARRIPLECEGNDGDEENGDGFMKLEGVKLPDASEWIGNLDEDGCGEECLKNCSCKAYAYATGIGCLVWGTDLKDIQQFDVGGNDIYIRLASSELVKKSKLQAYIITELIIGVAILLFCISIIWKYKMKIQGLWRRKRVTDISTLEGCLEENDSIIFSGRHDLREGKKGKSPDLPMFSLETIAIATNNFWVSNKLGQGGFGPVYKAKLPSGQEIAVKRLSKSSFQGLEEFKNEVRLIAQLQHRNLVRLVGCCIEGNEKILIYEYMPNKSLDIILFDPMKKELLDWNKRIDIIGGIARGILYLHRDSRLRVVHRDLKASNVLLDEEMNPKISDFGMARIFGGNQHQENTNRVVGTYGYMSPEYAMEGLFSMKSDVYSFGVLLLEIVSGKKNNDFHHKSLKTLLEHAWQLWNEKKTMEFVDPCIRSTCTPFEVMKYVHVGLLCVQDSADDRPTMASVVFMLGSETTSNLLPRQPTFTPRRSFARMESSIYLPSSNGISISTIFGR